MLILLKITKSRQNIEDILDGRIDSENMSKIIASDIYEIQKDKFVNAFMHVKEVWEFIRTSILDKLDDRDCLNLKPMIIGGDISLEFIDRHILFSTCSPEKDINEFYYLMEKDNEEPESEPKLMDDDSERVGYLKYRLMKYKESR